MVTDRPDCYIRKGCCLQEYFTQDTRSHLAHLWRVILNGELLIENVREAISKRLYFDSHAAFCLIDTDRDDFVRMKELRDFFANQGFYASDRELEGLFNRFDVDRCGKICYEHFRRGLMQQLPLQY